MAHASSANCQHSVRPFSVPRITWRGPSRILAQKSGELIEEPQDWLHSGVAVDLD